MAYPWTPRPPAMTRARTRPAERFPGRILEGRYVHIFRRYVPEDGPESFVALCGKAEEARHVELLAASSEPTCPICRAKRDA